MNPRVLAAIEALHEQVTGLGASVLHLAEQLPPQLHGAAPSGGRSRSPDGAGIGPSLEGAFAAFALKLGVATAPLAWFAAGLTAARGLDKASAAAAGLGAALVPAFAHLGAAAVAAADSRGEAKPLASNDNDRWVTRGMREGTRTFAAAVAEPPSIIRASAREPVNSGVGRTRAERAVEHGPRPAAVSAAERQPQPATPVSRPILDAIFGPAEGESHGIPERSREAGSFPGFAQAGGAVRASAPGPSPFEAAMLLRAEQVIESLRGAIAEIRNVNLGAG